MAKKSTVYTRTGDRGTTSLVGGMRVPKDNPRLEAYGTIDELNSWIGLLLAEPATLPPDSIPLLTSVQHRLFDIGSILATEPESKWQPAPLDPALVTELEKTMDTVDEQLPRHNRFILPGGHPQAARANIARTIARRAERRMVSLDIWLAQNGHAPIDPTAVKYINRLSDYLFLLGRQINTLNNTPEIFWEQ